LKQNNKDNHLIDKPDVGITLILLPIMEVALSIAGVSKSKKLQKEIDEQFY